MASRTASRRSPFGRIATILLVLAGLVVLGWTIAWFSAASWVESEFDARTTQLAREGRADVECGRRDVSGFPFAFRFRCDEDVVVDTDRAELAFAGFDAGASAFSPSTVRASLAGPANLRLAPAATVMADWRTADVTVEEAFGRRRVEAELSALALDAPRLDLAAESARLVLAPVGFDLDLDFAADAVTLVPEGRPAVTAPRLFVRARLEKLHHELLVRFRPFDRRDGVAGTIEALGLDTAGEGRLLVSGPFVVSPDGLVSGRFTIAVSDGAAVGALLSQLLEDASVVDGVLVGLETLGERRTIDGREMRAIELEARGGKMPLGFVTIDLPRVWGGGSG